MADITYGIQRLKERLGKEKHEYIEMEEVLYELTERDQDGRQLHHIQHCRNPSRET